MHESDTHLAILDEGQEKRARMYILIAGEEKIGPPPSLSKRHWDNGGYRGPTGFFLPKRTL